MEVYIVRKVIFETPEEKEALILEAENNGEILTEEANLTDENYLIFKTPDEIGNESLKKPDIEMLKEENAVLKSQLQQQKEQSAQLNQTLSDFMDFFFENNPNLA